MFRAHQSLLLLLIAAVVAICSGVTSGVVRGARRGARRKIQQQRKRALEEASSGDEIVIMNSGDEAMLPVGNIAVMESRDEVMLPVEDSGDGEMMSTDGAMESASSMDGSIMNSNKEASLFEESSLDTSRDSKKQKKPKSNSNQHGKMNKLSSRSNKSNRSTSKRSVSKGSSLNKKKSSSAYLFDDIQGSSLDTNDSADMNESVDTNEEDSVTTSPAGEKVPTPSVPLPMPTMTEVEETQSPVEVPVEDETDAPTEAPFQEEMPVATVAPTDPEPVSEVIVLTEAPTEAPLGTIVDIVVGNPDFSTLVELLRQADLVKILSDVGPFTVFAPTNDAFAGLPQETLDAVASDKEFLTSILRYHAVSGNILSTDLIDGAMMATINGADITTFTDPPMVNDANIVGADVFASNGVIHVIDTVLIPPDPTEAPVVATGAPTDTDNLLLNTGSPTTEGTPGAITGATESPSDGTDDYWALVWGSPPDEQVTPPDMNAPVIVEATLSYSFFQDDQSNVREPTEEEIDGLISQTNDFYLMSLRAIYPNLADFSADVVFWAYDETLEFPLVIEFDALGLFEEGAEKPTPEEFLGSMRSVDYNSYIEAYVWSSEPEGSVFVDTQSIEFKARAEQRR